MKLHTNSLLFLKSIQNQLISTNDLMEIIPIRGRKLTITLNRASYKIIGSTINNEIIKNTETINVPSSSEYTLPIYLELFENNEFQFFTIKGLNSDRPIAYNGTIINEGCLRNNDIIDLGHSILKFIKVQKKRNEICDQFEKLNLTDEILKSNHPILICGETGTGKTSLAKKIHYNSEVRGNFVHLNLSSFSKTIIESELFGHKKGSFTGAINDKTGAILEANEGTLFLDEIDSIDLDLQTKLLTFLDNNEFRIVGGATKKATVRIIFSSGKNLKKLVSEGKMRIDFYFRVISSFSVNLPTLRGDREYCRKIIYDILDSKCYSISKELLEIYLNSNWYGNIRQLKFHLKKKMLMSPKRHLVVEDCDLLLKNDHQVFENIVGNPDIITLESLKKWYVNYVYDLYRGDLKKITKFLGVSENTIRRSI